MKRFLMLIPMLCLCAISFGADKAGTDTGYLGADQWIVRADGDLVPVTDSSFDIGAVGSEVANLYADNVSVSSLDASNVLLSGVNFAADGEATDAYAITLDPAPAAYATGLMITFTATTANTGACTINVNALGAKALLSLNDVVPPDNYIEAGSVVVAVYDGTSFQMIQPDANPA